MIDKGQMLSRHDFSKVNWGILAAAALLFSVGAALLVLPLLSSIDESEAITLLQAGANSHPFTVQQIGGIKVSVTKIDPSAAVSVVPPKATAAPPLTV